MVPAAIDKSPILYNLVASPRLHVRIEEPVKQVSQVPQQSSTTIYTITSNAQTQEPVKQILPVAKQQPFPTLYSIVGSPTPTDHIPESRIIDPAPLTQPEKVTSVPSVPILYTLIGNPTQTDRISESHTTDHAPVRQSEKVNSVQPVPILYTVVGETQVPNNIPKANRQPLAPVKGESNNPAMYTVIGGPTIPQPIPMLPKTQPVQQEQEQHVPSKHPLLYSLVGKPNSSPEDTTIYRPKYGRSYFI